ncbi:MAG: response regulator [Prolixibacteraceae bacterium]|jgi:DNA-binding LytR/AlgR family response regulator|nr:response regulator [Prolixibacteraceae bacterium]
MNKEVRILIVEDEFMISEDIAMRIEDFGYTVEGTAASGEQALEILKKGKTDLALLDVNIDGDMDGIELSKIISSQYNIPFIFLTSLASKSIVERAKECNPSAYLLKPFNDRQVQIAIELALENFADNKVASTVEEASENKPSSTPVLSMNDSLFLKKDTHYERVKYSDIYYLSAESSYTLVYTKNGNFMYSCVLKKFEEKLPSNLFIRVHRSYIVNANYITGFEGNNLHVADRRIPVSKSYREELFKTFKVFK